LNYFRIHTDQVAYWTGQPRGLFVAVWKLVEAKNVTPDEERQYWKNREYFENRLPVPELYVDGNPSKVITFFKDNGESKVLMDELVFYFDLAEKYGLRFWRTTVDRVPGTLLYEDQFQIAVVPDAEVLKQAEVIEVVR
jgi:hypothetical protein